MKKGNVFQMKPVLIVGVVFVCMVIGTFFFAQMLFGIHYYRITEGPLCEKYMGKRFRMNHMEKDKIRAQKKGLKLLFCVSEDTSYEFVPYVFLPHSVSNDTDLSQYVGVFKDPKIYEVIDLYHTVTLGASSNVAICIIHGVPELEDIVFEKRVEDEVIAFRPGIDDIDVTDQTESEWTEERYQKVLNSKRSKVRGIKEYIKPGDRTKEAGGLILIH